MKLQIRVKPNSEKQKIESLGEGHYLVHLKSKPENNKANIELLNLMSKHLGVTALKIKIISGLTSREKILEIK